MEESGVSVARGHVRKAGMQLVARGLHRSQLTDLSTSATPDERAAHVRATTRADLLAWQQALRADACFTHLSAVIVRGWSLPEVPAALPVWIAQDKRRNHTRRRGARVLRLSGPPAYDEVAGLRLAKPVDVILACAQDLALLDLVVIIDSALHAGDVSMEELEQAARGRRQGAGRLGETLGWVDGRSESAWESLLRVLHVACGFQVEPQRNFYHQGRFVARADLWLIGTHSLHEYDGAEHRKAKRQATDLRRDRRIAEAGLVRRGYVRDDIACRPEQILYDACLATGRTFDLAALRPWHLIWHASSFGPLGKARLVQIFGVALVE